MSSSVIDARAAIAQPFLMAAQQPFFGQLLIGVSRTWRSVLEVRLRELGLTDASWAPLFHLHAAAQPLNLKQLAQRVGLESSSLVRVVDLLEQRGLLKRQQDAVDRRNKLLLLTQPGHLLVADVRAKLQQAENQLLDGMAPAVIAQLNVGLTQLHERLCVLQQHDRVEEGATA